jgi:hypothetical protein
MKLIMSEAPMTGLGRIARLPREMREKSSRVHSVRREDFNAKSRRRNNAKRFLTVPVRAAKRWMLLMEPISLPDISAALGLGVLALEPCRMGPAEAPIKPNQGESNQIKPNQTCAVMKCPKIGHAGALRCRWNAVRSNPIKPNQTGSNPIKPQKIKDSQETEQIQGGPPCELLAPPETVKPSQTQSKSKPIKRGKTQSNKKGKFNHKWSNLSEVLMLSSNLACRPIKPNQTKSNLSGGKNDEKEGLQ